MRIPPIYIILGVFLLAVAFVTVDQYLEGDEGPVGEDPTSNGINAEIVINNPEWGYIDVLSNNGVNPVFRAIPYEGYSFSAWVDRNGERMPGISGDTVSYEQIAGHYIKAVFAEGTTAVSGLSFSWQMPNYGSDGITYTEEVFNITISSEQYRQATLMDVNRTAIAGNVYLTPWNLCVDDYAVKQICSYLESKTQGQTDLMKANTILKFVQDITAYQYDSVLYGSNEYWATPLETVYNRAGDCEDTSVLFCSVAAKMGLDVGLVGFTYTDHARQNYGHMGAAVALTQGASVEGATTFVYDGRTYVFCETTNGDDMGILRYDPSRGVYLINDGTFTRIGYSDGHYNHDPTVSIASNYETSGDASGIYGDNVDRPPVIEMDVGDSFSYEPSTSLESVMTAKGNGLISEGGFLTFSDGILSGKAVSEGTFIVTLEAVWSMGELRQTAYQEITFKVMSSENGGSEEKVLSYASGGWILESTSDSDDSDPKGLDPKVTLVLAVTAVFLAVMAVRRLC